MRVTLRRGSSLAVRWRGETWRLERAQTRQVSEVAEYTYLFKVHSRRLEFDPPLCCARVARGSERRIVQPWLLRELRRDGWRLLRPEEALAEASSVLVVRNMGLGDVLMTTPLLRELKLCASPSGPADTSRPPLEVCLATQARYVPVLWGNPWVDSVVALGTDYCPERFDAAVDLDWYPELSRKADRVPRQQLMAEAAGVRVSDPRPVYRVAAEEAEFARRLLARARRPLVGIQVRATSRLRTYPPAQSRRTAALLLDADCGVVILDEAPDEGWPAAALDLSGALSIRQAAAIIGELDALIAPDSGLMHLAAAVGTPCVTLFGPTDPELRIAGYPRCVALQGNVTAGCPPCHDRPRCRVGPRQRPRCLSAIEPEQIAGFACSSELRVASKGQQQ